MILLTTTSDTLQFTTGTAVSTDWNCSWNDMNFAGSTMVPGSTEGNQTAIGTVALVAAPAAGDQRQVKFLSIVNRDPTNPQTIVVQKVGASGTYNLTGAWVLAAGWMLEYVDGDGFKLLNAVGAIQYVGSAGSAGAAGATGAPGVATYLDAETFEPDVFIVPGSPGAAGSTGGTGPQGVATYLDAEAFEPDVFIVPGSPGASGGQGVPGPATYLEAETIDAEIFIVPGNPGASGGQGVPGPAVFLEAESVDPDLLMIPGSAGPQGTQGIQGLLGYGPPGADGDQGDDGMPIPGNIGATGQTGSQGVPGPAVFLDAENVDPDVFLVPGNPGPQGSTGAQGPVAPIDMSWQMEIPDDQVLMPPFDRAAATQITGLSLEIVLSSGSAITLAAAQLQSIDAAVLILNSNSGAPKTVTLPASTGSLARVLVIDGFGDAGTNNISFSPVPVGVGVIYTNKGQLWLTDTKTLGWVSGI